MAMIIQLTTIKEQTPVWINFDLVTNFHPTRNGTEVIFLGQRFSQHRFKVKETPEQIGRMLGK